MLLALDIHPSRRVDLLTEQVLTFNPPLEAWGYVDVFGNACTRIVAPAGLTTISTDFHIYDSGRPDGIAEDAVQHEIKDLPDEVLVCPSSDDLAQFGALNRGALASSVG